MIHFMHFKSDNNLLRTLLFVESCACIIWFIGTFVSKFRKFISVNFAITSVSFSWHISLICLNCVSLKEVFLVFISASNSLVYQIIFVHFGITSVPFS